jgi:hypothetical protein
MTSRSPNVLWNEMIRFALLALLLLPSLARGGGNLLRNPGFQDDWATQVPQSKTLHWSYPYDYQNRRDYNPDGWTLAGSWEWDDADAPAGKRRLIVRGPNAKLAQRVNWVAVHDDRAPKGFPDAGGFPSLAVVRSLRPLGVVRDLTFRVWVKGRDVPAGAATIAVALDSPGEPSPADPIGTPTAPVALAEVSLPSGTFDWRWVEVRLASGVWRQAAQALAEKDSAEGQQASAAGLALPASARVTIRYAAAAGEIEIERTELVEAGSPSPNLLSDGGFEEKGSGDLPLGWEGPERYTYFPPGRYYLFNTWHNEGFENRGRPAIDSLVVHGGRTSLRMPVPAGDETAVRSPPVALHQKEPRLIEVTAWVKTDRVNQIQIDAVNEKGERLDGFDFINKALISIGTDDWRLVRQVFRPRAPVESVRVLLCARGVNGYTLGGRAYEPQNNAAGTVWWDDVRLAEPESTEAELAARGVAAADARQVPAGLRLTALELGERLVGENVLLATVAGAEVGAKLGLELEIRSPRGKHRRYATPIESVSRAGTVSFRLPYALEEACPAYTEYRAALRIVSAGRGVLAATEVSFATWADPLALEIGARYLRPEQQSQLVRLNLGLSSAAMAQVAAVRLELVRRCDGAVLVADKLPADTAALRARRLHVPAGLRGDLTNLVLADLDVSSLPVEPFDHPERRWLVRAAVLDRAGRALASTSSAPFCRQGHAPPQPSIRDVAVHGDRLEVNKEVWIPWAGIYGFMPSYDGPADPPPGATLDLQNLPPWSYYTGFTSAPYNRRGNDFSSSRDFPGYDPVTNPKTVRRIEDLWKDDNLYTATFFVVPSPGVMSTAELAAKAGGEAKLDGYLDFAKKAPMVVSVGPGFEESFGAFDAATPEELGGLEQVVELLRRRTGKPVMVGHGGAWNRFEFEKVPFFDVYDPETEPLFPANLHTDLRPLLAGKDKVVWLRPQIYESVPYERWRFHAFVELLRGARGWQIAHGPADESTLRGLHGEIESLRPALSSGDAGPVVRIDPWIEHWSRRYAGKTYLIAATTHALTFGSWRWVDDPKPPDGRRSRLSEAGLGELADNRLERIVNAVEGHWVGHSIDSFPNVRRWPDGTRLVQWVRLDPQATPRTIALLVRIDGRWESVATWGSFDLDSRRADPLFGYWFLRHFHRNAVGFIGYGGQGLASSLSYLPRREAVMGPLPAAGQWVKLEVPLAALSAVDRPIEGVGFLHDSGRAFWGHTSLVGADGEETTLWGDSMGLPAQALERVRISLDGLEAGTKVRVLFEDREIRSSRGFFVDDFRGQDLYQRYGGRDGYGGTPVALHLYKISTPEGRH